MSIQGLAQSTALESGDQIPVGDFSEGQDRRASLSLLAEWLQSQLTAGTEQVQYSAPSSSGFSVTITPVVTGGNVWLQLAPLAGYATGTVVLPVSTSLVNNQEVLVTCTQTVTTLTVSGNGATVNGAPAAFTQHGFFRLRYSTVGAVWQRIG